MQIGTCVYMRLEPRKGWKKFKKCDQLLEFISTSLCSVNSPSLIISDKLTEKPNKSEKHVVNKNSHHAVNWEHYCFSEHIYVWCSNELNARNQLQITFEQASDQTSIQLLGIEMTKNSGLHFKALYRLKRELKRRFRLIEV